MISKNISLYFINNLEKRSKNTPVDVRVIVYVRIKWLPRLLTSFTIYIKSEILEDVSMVQNPIIAANKKI